MTTAGMTLAETPATQTLSMTMSTAALASTQQIEAATDEEDLTTRRAAGTSSAALLTGRTQEAERVARAAKREEILEQQRKAAAQKAKEATAKRWVDPIAGGTGKFTSAYGQRWGRLHAGIDLATPVGTPLRSMSKGVVIDTGRGSSSGRFVRVKFWDNTVAYYYHMSSISVSVGDELYPGDIVGRSGNSGHSYGPHLHLEIHPNGGGPINPIPWLSKRGIDI